VDVALGPGRREDGCGCLPAAFAEVDECQGDRLDDILDAAVARMISGP